MTGNIVYPIEDILLKIGKSDQAQYIESYLRRPEINCSIILEEKEYIDKDYLIDFSNFYVRSFKFSNKYTTRYHFFEKPFSNKQFFDALEAYDTSFFNFLKTNYQGFVVVKPISDKFGEPYIGRTLLKTYPKLVAPHDKESEQREFLKQKYCVSLFGISLNVESLPFQAQDSAVGGCATTACWVALHPINRLFDIPLHSQYELTNLSLSFPTLDRNFPSCGLTPHQIKSQFTALGLDTEFLNIESIDCISDDYSHDKDDIIADIVKSYTSLQLPLIAALKLHKKGGGFDLHAAVISGYRHNNGKVTELYIHDDQIGPFHHVTPLAGNFLRWENDWLQSGDYVCIEVERIIIPIYHKLRLPFGKIYSVFLALKRQIEDIPSSNQELFLISLNNYKSYLLEQKFKDKAKILEELFPHFLWIIRTRYKNKIKEDRIFDATAVNPIVFKRIRFG
jgi:hypothetical protein